MDGKRCEHQYCDRCQKGANSRSRVATNTGNRNVRRIVRLLLRAGKDPS